MDGNVFDAVTRSFAVRSRRSLLKTLVTGLIGGGFATLVESDADAASCRASGAICREHANCCSDVCGEPDRFGRRRCECQTEDDCPVPSNKCKLPVCTDGACTTTTVTCTASDQCHIAGTCDPATGVCFNPPAPNDTPCDDGDICTSSDTCQDGTCIGTPLGNEGETCSVESPCCTGLTCTVDDICCPTAISCSGPLGENPICCPNATDVCTADGTCCSAEKACVFESEIICCDEFTVCTATGRCCQNESSCNAPNIGPICCANADDVCTTEGFCCPPESLCVVGGESTCCPLPERACPSLDGTSCSCCGFDETCFEGSCVFGDG